MKTAELVNGEVVFASPADFDEAIKVGFFRVRTPKDLNLARSRAFARQFSANSTYTGFVSQNPVDGFSRPEGAQSVHFCLERDKWNKAYPKDICEIGNRLTEIGSQILCSILAKFDLPRDLWFKATSGASHDEGSCYLVFRHYDPGVKDKAFGLREHRDWGYITVLDATADGLEAEIDGVWQPLLVEEGFLIVNFGEPLHKLLPEVNASNHRVTVQTTKSRYSTILFIDPRVGPYRSSSGLDYKEGLVWEWEPQTRRLVNGQTTLSYFEQMSKELYS